MRLDRRERVAGVPMKDARDFLRTMTAEEQIGATIARARGRFGKAVNALAVINELEARGWIERCVVKKEGRRTTICRLTPLGGKVTATKLIYPLQRAKAQSFLADFLKRVGQVNANPELTHFVKEVLAYAY